MSRILVVEDEALIALDLARQLRGAGHEVVGPCRDGADALRRIAEAGPEAAVLDYTLRGTETSEGIASDLADRGIPFAFLTGHAASGLIARGPFADRPRLTKPCSPDELLRAVRDLLSGPAPWRDGAGPRHARWK